MRYLWVMDVTVGSTIWTVQEWEDYTGSGGADVLSALGCGCACREPPLGTPAAVASTQWAVTGNCNPINASSPKLLCQGALSQ